jgi:16S rRNA pseudouridine516 synthase
MDHLPAALPLRRELRAIGRLDKDTTGLLLWTTDGTLLHKLTHPRYAIPRTYHAVLSGPYDPLPDDLVLDDGHRPRVLALREIPRGDAHPALQCSADAAVLAEITVTTGRFHEVRRIFAALGSHVDELCRVQFGPIALPPDLGAGGCREIDLHEVFRGLHPQK